MSDNRHQVAPVIIVDSCKWLERLVTLGIRSMLSRPVDRNPHRQAVNQDPDRDKRRKLDLAVAVFEVL